MLLIWVGGAHGIQKEITPKYKQQFHHFSLEDMLINHA